ncbi:hypothetical protein ACJMK2_039557 [Sinanodonta woodiana]|uniref:Discoidin domain-containing receptor 2 n=1 Tax=Sinanodonta woodiana TaxID=1069815 RepID=A0ABD3WCE3_SINWO
MDVLYTVPLSSVDKRQASMCCCRKAYRKMPDADAAVIVIVALFLVLDFGIGVTALELAQCRNSLGMQSGEIPDSAITASSSYEDSSVGPKNARIRTEKNGGAWCPKPVIARDTYEYLQIDLYQLTVITMVEIQGRFGNGQGQEFTEEFLLEYQREDGGEWMRFKNKRGEERFEGNDNTYLAELREVEPPIIAKRVRFIPYCRNPRTVCMRVEIYGCKWEDNVVSYSMRQGEKRGADVDLFDFTYDGIILNNFLFDGLGQLTDGEVGETNFRLDPQDLGIKGYEWVGWRNDSLEQEGQPVEIIFKFETVRNFSSVIINSNNYFSKEVRVFRMALIYISNGGEYYQPNPIKFDFLRDTLVEYARPVMIRLNNRIGRYVKLQLFFDAKWLLISEIQFISEPAKGNFTVESPPPTTLTPSTPARHVVNPQILDFEVDKDSGARVEIGPDTQVPPNEEHLVPEEKKSFEDKYIGIIIGTLSALIVLLSLIVLIVILRYRRRKQNNNRRNLKPCVDHVTMNLNDLQSSINGKILNGNMYNGVPSDDMDSDREFGNTGDKILKGPYSEPKDSIMGRELPDLPSSSEITDSRDYAIPDVTKSALVVALPPLRSALHTPVRPNGTNALDKPPTYDALYAASDVLSTQVPNIPSLQGVSGNSIYSVPNADLLLTIDLSVVEFPRGNLRFIEVLGEGQFGEVHLCEAVNIADYLPEDYFINRNANRPVLVAVKMLRKNADDRARADFQKEIRIMSQLKDPNIVRVLGVCTMEEPLCMIVEYMKYGDLNQFLLEHVPESPIAQAANAKMLSYGCLIYMATQIASGMKYLESLNMVHRDLATRNCLVGTNFTIKISDFGMSRSLYSADYYRIEGRAVLPIRWMAWESILLGKFTTKSDVWSFAVTLWEILTFARDQPLDGLLDEQVIENAGHYYRNDNKQVYLPHPPICPKEIYDLMKECWNRQESERPSFREVHMFLQRKNMGYNPKDEKMNQIKVPVC